MANHPNRPASAIKMPHPVRITPTGRNCPRELALTDSARTQFEQVRSLQMELGEELVAPLDTQQRRQLLDLLSRLNQGVLTDEAGDEE